MLAYFFIRSMREQGPLIWLPIQCGNAEPLALTWPRYFDRVVYLAVLLDDRLHDVVDGLKQFGIGVGRQVVIARMSWPDFA